MLQATEACERLFESIYGTNRRKTFVAEKGFTLPTMDGFEWRPIGNPANSNWAICALDFSLYVGREIEFNDATKDNVVITWKGARVTDKTVILGDNNIVVYGEENRQRLRLNLYVDGNSTPAFFGSKSTCNGASAFVQGRRNVADCLR